MPIPDLGSYDVVAYIAGACKNNQNVETKERVAGYGVWFGPESNLQCVDCAQPVD
jgi:hypothetical protein